MSADDVKQDATYDGSSAALQNRRRAWALYGSAGWIERLNLRGGAAGEGMVARDAQTKVYLARGRTDMRFQIDGLAAQVGARA